LRVPSHSHSFADSFFSAEAALARSSVGLSARLPVGCGGALGSARLRLRLAPSARLGSLGSARLGSLPLSCERCERLPRLGSARLGSARTARWPCELSLFCGSAPSLSAGVLSQCGAMEKGFAFSAGERGPRCVFDECLLVRDDECLVVALRGQTLARLGRSDSRAEGRQKPRRGSAHTHAFRPRGVSRSQLDEGPFTLNRQLHLGPCDESAAA